MCKRFIVNNISDNIIIDGQEHIHLASVLRLKVGDKVIVTSNDDYDYECEIVEIGKRETKCKLLNKTTNLHNPRKTIDVYQALIKNDKMSLVVQKLSELGISNLKLFETKFQTVKPSENKQEKLYKISEQSSKQCKRSLIMNVDEPIKFADMISQLNDYDLVVFANETENSINLTDNIDTISKADKIAIIIGSEGGFDESEIKAIIGAGAISVSLGNRILRAETAAIALSAFVSLLVNN